MRLFDNIKSDDVRALCRKLFTAPDGFVDSKLGSELIEKSIQTVRKENPEDAEAFEAEMAILKTLG